MSVAKRNGRGDNGMMALRVLRIYIVIRDGHCGCRVWTDARGVDGYHTHNFTLLFIHSLHVC